MQYEVIDISGDVGIKAVGNSMAEAYANAVMGMYNLVTDICRVDERESNAFDISGDSPEDVLVGCLNELIYRFDAYGFIGKRVEVTDITGTSLHMRVHGEEFDPERHERRLLIKAATYHNIRVEQTDGKWQVEVIFDI